MDKAMQQQANKNIISNDEKDLKELLVFAAMASGFVMVAGTDHSDYLSEKLMTLVNKVNRAYFLDKDG